MGFSWFLTTPSGFGYGFISCLAWNLLLCPFRKKLIICEMSLMFCQTDNPRFSFYHVLLLKSLICLYMWRTWLNRFIRIGRYTINPNVLHVWSKKFHVLCTFQRRLPSLSTLDEWLALVSGDATIRSNSKVASCILVYIGETGRKFGTRLEEH